MTKKKKGSAQSKNTSSKTETPPSKATQPEAPTANAKSGFELVSFLKGSREELAKIVWPSRQQLIGESVTVILMVTLVATTIYLVDNLFIQSIKYASNEAIK